MENFTDDFFYDNYNDNKQSVQGRNSIFDIGSTANSQRNSLLNLESKRSSQNHRSIIFGEGNSKILEERSRTSLVQLPDLINQEREDFGIRFFCLPDRKIETIQIESRKLLEIPNVDPVLSNILKPKIENTSQVDLKKASNDFSKISTKIKKKRQPRKKNETNKLTDNCCNCQKTKCLKLYCECFANGGTCGPKCKCNDCHNIEDLQDLRDLIIQETLEKNPLAFKSKYKSIEAQEQQLHTRRCNCKKTECSKNYCECFTAGIGCSPLCKCSDCKNNFKSTMKEEEVAAHHEKVLRKRKKPNYLYEFYFNKYTSLKKSQ
jgi:hypothetical protein